VSAPLRPKEKDSWLKKNNSRINKTTLVLTKTLKAKRVTLALMVNMEMKITKTNDEVLFYSLIIFNIFITFKQAQCLLVLIAL